MDSRARRFVNLTIKTRALWSTTNRQSQTCFQPAWPPCRSKLNQTPPPTRINNQSDRLDLTRSDQTVEVKQDLQVRSNS